MGKNKKKAVRADKTNYNNRLVSSSTGGIGVSGGGIGNSVEDSYNDSDNNAIVNGDQQGRVVNVPIQIKSHNAHHGFFSGAFGGTGVEELEMEENIKQSDNGFSVSGRQEWTSSGNALRGNGDYVSREYHVTEVNEHVYTDPNYHETYDTVSAKGINQAELFLNENRSGGGGDQRQRSRSRSQANSLRDTNSHNNLDELDDDIALEIDAVLESDLGGNDDGEIETADMAFVADDADYSDLHMVADPPRNAYQTVYMSHENVTSPEPRIDQQSGMRNLGNDVHSHRSNSGGPLPAPRSRLHSVSSTYNNDPDGGAYENFHSSRKSLNQHHSHVENDVNANFGGGDADLYEEEGRRDRNLSIASGERSLAGFPRSSFGGSRASIRSTSERRHRSISRRFEDEEGVVVRREVFGGAPTGELERLNIGTGGTRSRNASGVSSRSLNYIAPGFDNGVVHDEHDDGDVVVLGEVAGGVYRAASRASRGSRHSGIATDFEFGVSTNVQKMQPRNTRSRTVSESSRQFDRRDAFDESMGSGMRNASVNFGHDGGKTSEDGDVRTIHPDSRYSQHRLSKLSIHTNNDEFVLVGGLPPMSEGQPSRRSGGYGDRTQDASLLSSQSGVVGETWRSNMSKNSSRSYVDVSSRDDMIDEQPDYHFPSSRNDVPKILLNDMTLETNNGRKEEAVTSTHTSRPHSRTSHISETDIGSDLRSSRTLVGAGQRSQSTSRAELSNLSCGNSEPVFGIHINIPMNKELSDEDYIGRSISQQTVDSTRGSRTYLDDCDNRHSAKQQQRSRTTSRGSMRSATTDDRLRLAVRYSQRPEAEGLVPIASTRSPTSSRGDLTTPMLTSSSQVHTIVAPPSSYGEYETGDNHGRLSRSTSQASNVSDRVNFSLMPTLYSHPDDRFDDKEPGEPFRPTSEHQHTPLGSSRRQQSMRQGGGSISREHSADGRNGEVYTSEIKMDVSPVKKVQRQDPVRPMIVTSAITPQPVKRTPSSIDRDRLSVRHEVLQTPQTVISAKEPKCMRTIFDPLSKTTSEIGIQTGDTLRLKRGEWDPKVLDQCNEEYDLRSPHSSVFTAGVSTTRGTAKDPMVQSICGRTRSNEKGNGQKPSRPSINNSFERNGHPAASVLSNMLQTRLVDNAKNQNESTGSKFLDASNEDQFRSSQSNSSHQVTMVRQSDSQMTIGITREQFVQGLSPMSTSTPAKKDVNDNFAAETNLQMGGDWQQEPFQRTGSEKSVASGQQVGNERIDAKWVEGPRSKGDTIRKHLPRGRIRDLASAFNKVASEQEEEQKHRSPSRTAPKWKLTVPEYVERMRGRSGERKTSGDVSLRGVSERSAASSHAADLTQQQRHTSTSDMHSRASSNRGNDVSSTTSSTHQLARQQPQRKRGSSSTSSSQHQLSNVFTRNTFVRNSTQMASREAIPSNVPMSTTYSQMKTSENELVKGHGDGGFVSMFERIPSIRDTTEQSWAPRTPVEHIKTTTAQENSDSSWAQFKDFSTRPCSAKTSTTPMRSTSSDPRQRQFRRSTSVSPRSVFDEPVVDTDRTIDRIRQQGAVRSLRKTFEPKFENGDDRDRSVLADTSATRPNRSRSAVPVQRGDQVTRILPTRDVYGRHVEPTLPSNENWQQRRQNNPLISSVYGGNVRKSQSRDQINPLYVDIPNNGRTSASRDHFSEAYIDVPKNRPGPISSDRQRKDFGNEKIISGSYVDIPKNEKLIGAREVPIEVIGGARHPRGERSKTQEVPSSQFFLPQSSTSHWTRGNERTTRATSGDFGDDAFDRKWNEMTAKMGMPMNEDMDIPTMRISSSNGKPWSPHESEWKTSHQETATRREAQKSNMFEERIRQREEEERREMEAAMRKMEEQMRGREQSTDLFERYTRLMEQKMEEKRAGMDALMNKHQKKFDEKVKGKRTDGRPMEMSPNLRTSRETKLNQMGEPGATSAHGNSLNRLKQPSHKMTNASYSPPLTEDAGSRITHHTTRTCDTMRDDVGLTTEESSIRGKIDKMFAFVEEDAKSRGIGGIGSTIGSQMSSAETLATGYQPKSKEHRFDKRANAERTSGSSRFANYLPVGTQRQIDERGEWEQMLYEEASRTVDGKTSTDYEMRFSRGGLADLDHMHNGETHMTPRRRLIEDQNRRKTVAGGSPLKTGGVSDHISAHDDYAYSLSQYREMQREQQRRRGLSSDEPQFFRSPSMMAPHAGQSMHAYRARHLLGAPAAGEKIQLDASYRTRLPPTALATSTPVDSPQSLNNERSGFPGDFLLRGHIDHNGNESSFVSSISGISSAEQQMDARRKINRMNYMIENTAKQQELNELALLDAMKKGRQQQEIAAHRSMLIGRESLRLQRAELRRLHAMSAVRRPPPPLAEDLKGSVVFSNIIIHLNKNFVQRLSDNGSYAFVVIFKSGHQCEATEFVSLNVTQNVVDGIDKLAFEKPIQFSNMPVDFSVTLEVYAMRVPLSKQIDASCGTSFAMKCRNLMGPPQRKAPPPSTETAFKLRGKIDLDRDASGDRCFYLDDVTYPLEGTIQINTRCTQLPDSMETDHRGFLTMYHTVSGMASWDRYWAVLRRGAVFFWRYPDDEQMGKSPLLQIDLTKCTNSSIERCPFDVCPRPNSFAVEMLIESDVPLQTTSSSHQRHIDTTPVVEKKRVLLSADSADLLDSWLYALNQTLNVIRG